ncbi:MAG: DNA-3-methyladenine glycosylase I [Elusimicrobiota bacterium]
MKKPLTRCRWVPPKDALYVKYHDEEWGVPVRSDRKIYEFLILETFQAGLSWRIVLGKRENFRKAFVGFDFHKIAKFGPREEARILGNPGVVRNRAKIAAAVHNAKCFLAVRREFGSFSKYMWSWAGTKAEDWAKDLKARGFKFLGPTVVYAHMQAAGMVNDHAPDCFRRKPGLLSRV